ncbi:TPA: hypothetical protein LT055_003169 [Salmonella enterica subsp. enterica serovar Wedding]|nr:hypothetical protein [Salmonella enterica subsp. enterica serovar Wedding]HBM0101629.1 hypothetical protein [Salmonella enterica subsp. enterica serovar Wedding]
MKNHYVHVSLFNASSEQKIKFKEVMCHFGYRDFFNTGEDTWQLPPGGYIGKSTLNCQEVVNQTFSIANSVGLNAYIFTCEFQNAAELLPGYGMDSSMNN